MDKPISEQIKAVKIKPEYELTGNQLLELKNGSGDFYQSIYNAFKFGKGYPRRSLAALEYCSDKGGALENLEEAC